MQPLLVDEFVLTAVLTETQANALAHRSWALRQAGQTAQALALLTPAINSSEAARRCAPLQHEHGQTLRQLGRLREAIISFDRAIALNPAYTRAWLHRANTQYDLGDRVAALADYDQALALDGQNATAWQNRGLALADLGRHDEALVSLERAIAADPNHVEAHWNLALVLLRLGDEARSWQEFEWRWQRPSMPMAGRHLRKPRWQPGAALQGKTVLLYAEQGLGDTLQFCRYVPWVVEQGARVLLLVQTEIAPLLAGLFDNTQIVASGATLPPYDLHAPLMSIAWLAGEPLRQWPVAHPYLSAPESQIHAWRTRFGESRKARVGLVAGGNPAHGNDKARSIGLARLLATLPRGPHYVCLQRDLRAGDREAMQARGDVFDASSQLTDFCVTAGLCACMDLVISVDTSVVHLSGALGRPTWLLLPFNSDWRWGIERTDTHWYPTMTLWREHAPGERNALLARVAQCLTDQIACSD